MASPQRPQHQPKDTPTISNPVGWDFYVSLGDLRRSTPTFDEENPPKLIKNPEYRQLFRAFWQMAMPYFREQLYGRWLFGVLVFLMMTNSAVRVFFSYLARDFWSALGDKDQDEFYRIIIKFLVALVCLAPINVLYRYQQQRLSIHWRKWMTLRLLELYSSNRVYYNLERSYDSPSGGAAVMIDNPDQRIAEDIKSFTGYSLNLFLTTCVSLIDLACFSVILYSIMPELFLSILAFAVFGTLISVLIGKRLVSLNFHLLRNEADFRYSLVRVRDNAESIAFFRGESIESKEVHTRLDKVISNAHQVIGAQRNLDFFTSLYNYVTWILPLVVIAPQYFAGVVELGVVQQSASAFSHVLDDLSIIINEFESLTAFSASIDRLHQFVSAVQAADPDRQNDDPKDPLMSKKRMMQKQKKDEDLEKDGIMIQDLSSTLSFPKQQGRIQLQETTGTTMSYCLLIRNLRLVTPDRSRILLDAFNMDLPHGKSLLIYGPSGVGKSSLLRAIAGLWKNGSGTIERPNDTYFLPQKPYCPLGTLRDQLLYPASPYKHFLSNTELLDILARVELSDLATRLGKGDPIQGLETVMEDWSNTLSLGEQQRLAFGRILVHQVRPRGAIFYHRSDFLSSFSNFLITLHSPD